MFEKTRQVTVTVNGARRKKMGACASLDSTVDQDFKPNHRCEVLDKSSKQICVATITTVTKEKLKIHFDGSPNEFDFWIERSKLNGLVFPVGYCKRMQLDLTEPPGYSDETFNWDTYLQLMHAKAAPESLWKVVSHSNY